MTTYQLLWWNGEIWDEKAFDSLDEARLYRDKLNPKPKAWIINEIIPIEYKL